MIPLYSYQDAFYEGKMRPGFRAQGVLFVLTSVKPKSNYMILAGPCCSGHFSSQGKKYVTLASNQEARRYNNVTGGYLSLDVKKFERKFKVDLTHYLTTNSSLSFMKKVQCFGVLPNGTFFLTSPAEFQAATGLDDATLKVNFGLEKEGAPLVVEGVPESFAEMITVAQTWTSSDDEAGKENAAKWAAKLQKAALGQARAVLTELLTAAHDADTAVILAADDMLTDADVPTAIAEFNALLTSTEETRAAAQAAVDARFGNPVATWNGEAFEVPSDGTPVIDPAQLEEAIQANQVPTAGTPAEALVEALTTEETVDVPTTEETPLVPEVQIAETLPTTAPPVAQLAVELVRNAAVDAKADRQEINRRYTEDLNKIEARMDNTLSLAEKLILASSAPVESKQIEEAIPA